MEKKFVEIQSTVNITVTPGLVNKDVTNPDAHVADRLKVQPLWPQLTVDIKKGIAYYPAYIVKWNTVKQLVKEKIITIGSYSETADENDTAKKEALDLNIKKIKQELNPKVEATQPTMNQTTEVKQFNLDDLVGE